MRRYLKYIFITLLCSLLAVSCLEEIDSPQAGIDSDALTLVPRVTGFANQYVTKAAYVGNEGKITSLAVLVFDNNGTLVHIHESEGSGPITLNKSMINTPAHKTYLDKATIVMIANMDLANIKNGNTELKDGKPTLSDFQNNYSFHFDGQTVMTSIGNGLPMMGMTAQTVNLTSTVVTNPVTVNLQILYAKINFEIKVTADGENTGTGMSFKLNNYSVHNVSAQTKVTKPTGATPSTNYTYTGDTGAAGNKTNVTANLSNSQTFTFYVAESRYTPGSTEGIYPTGLPDDHKQQYKPALAASTGGSPAPAAGLATYVLLNGEYTDYRGKLWAVDYKVYLGKDNHSNFEVDRNSEYTNHITIKGIRDNSTHTDREVWFDHRVEASTETLADNVTITRETLIDSHIEVRPLRVKWEGDTYSGVRVYLPTYDDGSLVEWIGIERFTGENCKNQKLYCYNGGYSTGKRRYFTDDLIKELQSPTLNSEMHDDNGRKYLNLENGDCAWIYFDENTTSSNRTADIIVEFYPSEEDPQIYKVHQSCLKSIGGYMLESYEEYLHSYDSDDTYTISTSPLDYTQIGLEWGLNGVYLSTDHIVSGTAVPGIESQVAQALIGSRTYDFFHKDDDPKNTYHIYSSNKIWEELNSTEKSRETGLYFTDRASYRKDIPVIDMATLPQSAYQYCLSKNKFEVDNNGDIQMTMHWYLPDVYEYMSVFNDPQYGQAADDLNSVDYYWSSQPAYSGFEQDILGTTFAFRQEDDSKARAVSSKGESSIARTTPNRIRCFYSANGVTADMTTREPDGYGPVPFYMKAWKDWNTQEPGYFHYLLPDRKKKSVSGGDYKMDDIAYPTGAEHANQYFGAYKDGYGFEKNPRDSQYHLSREVGSINKQTDHYVLGKWPGLTTKHVVLKNTGLQGIVGDDYYTFDGDKEESKTEIISDRVEYSGENFVSENLDYLDWMIEGNDLSISFSIGNGTNKPIYKYLKEYTRTPETTTRTWVLPTYKENKEVLSSNPYSLRTPGGQVQLNGDEQGVYDKLQDYVVTIFGNTVGYKRERLSNSEGYIYPDEDAARTAGNNAAIAINEKGEEVVIPSSISRNVTVESKSVSWYTYYEKTGSGLSTRYTQKTKSDARYRYRITYTVEGEVKYYYALDTPGEWQEGSPVPGTQTTVSGAPENDKLEIYGGNSFTIRANNGFKISSVRIHFEDSNVVDELGSGHDYLRFTKGVFTGAQDVEPPGMRYTEDGDSGIMTWSGTAQEEVTFNLGLIQKIYESSGFGSYTGFRYISHTDDSKKESIVIKQIDVKYH